MTTSPQPESPEPLKVVAHMRADGSEWSGFGSCRPGDVEAFAVTRLSDAEAAIQAARNEAEAMRADAERLPADLPTRIQVSYSPDDWDTFIFGVSGQLTMEALNAIDASIREDAEALFDKGPGEYLLSASHFKGQYGFEGRCEIAPGWELSVESFVPLDDAVAAMKGDAHA